MIETRSMIYTEYFVKGTQPTDDVSAARGSRRFIDRAGRRLRQGHRARRPCRSTRPGLPAPGAAGEHRRAPRRAPAPGRCRRKPRPRSRRRSAASGRASSAAATRRDEERKKKKKDEARRKSPAGDTILPARHALSRSRRAPRPARSRRRARLRAVAAAQPDLRRARRRREARSPRSRWRSCSTARAWSARPTASSRPTRAATCAACRRIARGVHADVLVDRAGRDRLDQGRSGPRRRSSAPPTGRSKAAAASSSSTRRTR